MRLKKFISGSLALGILLNSIPINSFASILSEDTRYETFEGSDITIKNILEENKINIEVEGNTLISPLRNACYGGSSKIVDKLNNGIINKISSNGNYFMIDSDTNNYLKLKNNTTYTVNISGTLEFDTNNEVSVVPFYRIINDNGDGETTHKKYYKVKNQKYFNIKHVFTTKDEIMHSFGFYTNPCENIKNINVFYHIIEGDWTNKDMPKYFEGLKSSFEEQRITQEMVDLGEEKVENVGKYKVQVTTEGGKNLFNKNNVQKVYIDGNENIGNIADTVSGYNRSSAWIPCKPNTYYTVSGGQRNRWLLKNDKGELTYIGETLGTETPTIKTNSDTVEFMCYVVYNDLSFLDSVQIEEGPIVTEYEPYKESVSTFYLNSPLLKGDTIEYINGQAYHVRKSDKVILDGNETWNNIGIQGYEGSFIRFSNSNINGVKPKTILISDKFKSEKYTSVSQLTKEFIFSHHSDINRIDILIEVSRLSEATTEGFKSWLKNNPVTVVYELVEPIIEPIKADLSVQLFEGATHVSNNSNIPATMKVTVDRTLNRAVEAIEVAKTNPTIENLSKARYWNNLLRDSIKKEQFQEELNNITNISDMELEKKINTSNLDVYIKSENILQMSLDTNSISFDDFSGIEDVEKVNAVNLTINSSLPYQINAYLPAEIQNSDKTKTLDKSILNIKENSESNYQTFDNTTDKIILKDNCSSGNQLTHGVDLKLAGGIAHEKDVYKAIIRLEAEQK